MIDKLIERPAVLLAIGLLVCGYLFCFRLGDLALTDPDETFYAQTTKEMVARGEWVTPYLYGKPQFEKPILFYWLTGAAFRLCGPTEFAARLPSALCAIVTVIATYLIGVRLANRRAGIWAALIMAMNVETIIVGRGCVTDMTLTMFITLGMLAFYAGHQRAAPLGYYLAAAFFGAAVLTKGPIGVLLPGLIILIYLVLVRDFSIFKRPLVIWWSLVIFTVIALPWYLVAYRLHGSAFIDVFFGFHNVVRFLEPEHKIGSEFYYYLPIIIGGFFPWSVFLPVTAWQAIAGTTTDTARRRAFIFTGVWALAIIIFFSISRTKLTTYVFPAFPALALLVGMAVDELTRTAASPKLTRAWQWSFYVLVAVVIGTCIGGGVFISIRYPALIGSVAITAAPFLVGTLAAAVLAARGRFILAAGVIAGAIILVVYPLVRLVMPLVEPYESNKAVAQRILALSAPGEVIGAEKDFVPGLTFYTGRPIVQLDVYDDRVKLVTSPQRVWGVLKQKNLVDFHIPSIPGGVQPVYRIEKVGKKWLFTNQPFAGIQHEALQ